MIGQVYVHIYHRVPQTLYVGLATRYHDYYAIAECFSHERETMSEHEQQTTTNLSSPITGSDLASSAPDTAPSLQRFFMTSDLRAATGLTRTHLDFYLRENIIVPTARTESGYLLFNEAELAVLRQVIDWRQAGVSIRAIRTRLGRTNGDEVSDD